MKDISKQIVTYTIDAHNNLISLEEGWESAATVGGADSLAQKNTIVGHSINEFMTDESTRQYYEGIFNVCRLNKEVIINEYRCDSPSHERYMKMTLRADDNGNITIQNETLYEVPFLNNIHMHDITADGPEFSKNVMKRCSICNRLKSDENLRWIEPKTLTEKETMHIDITHTLILYCYIKNGVILL